MKQSSSPTAQPSSLGNGLEMGFVDPPGPFDTPENYRSFIAEMQAAPPSARRNQLIAEAQKGLRRALALGKASKK